MHFSMRQVRECILLAFICTQVGRPATAQQTQAGTFVIAISLKSPTIHVGEGPTITMITSNPTDHIVYAGQGRGGGPQVELINENGDESGIHAMGGVSQHPNSDFVLGPLKEGIGPGHHARDVWPLKPEPGYLLPGAYKTRIHRRDVNLRVDVYSNAVTLTILP